jgi:hypothetical protein
LLKVNNFFAATVELFTVVFGVSPIRQFQAAALRSRGATNSPKLEE